MLVFGAFDNAWLNPQLAPVLIAIILLAAAGTVVLFGVGLLAYSRRGTTRYLLITVVLGLLVGRSVVGLGTVFGLVPMTVHHLTGHTIDFLIAVTVLYVVYQSGTKTERYSFGD